MPYMNITESELLGLGNRPFRGLRGFSGSASAKLWFESPNPVQAAMLALQNFLGTELTAVWDEPTHLALSDLNASFHDGVSTLPAWGANPSRVAEGVAELLYCGDDPDSWDALTDLAKALGYGTLTYAESRSLFGTKAATVTAAIQKVVEHVVAVESGTDTGGRGLITSGKGHFLQTSNPVKTYLLGIQKYLNVEQTGVWDPTTYDAVKEWWRVFETSIEGDEQPTEIPAWGAGLTGSGKAPGSLGLELLHVQNGVGVRAPLFAILGLPTTEAGLDALETDALEAQFAAFKLDFLRHAASQEQKSRESFVTKSLFSNPWVWGGAGAVALLVLWAATRGRSGGTKGLRGLGQWSSSNSNFDQYLKRGEARHGTKFSSVGLAKQFIPYYNSHQRIEVETCYPGGHCERRRGYVAATGGWQPSFMLMGRCGQMGSSDLLHQSDKIVATFRKYCNR